MAYQEKKNEEKSASGSIHEYHDSEEASNEPPKEESLHRGLKARQISMIAVCFLRNHISNILLIKA